ncbi:hypothetical protein [Haloarcula onubensis]|uniref:Uncharacterized protein n=1 Tax=Haloarcula onubensis TaxID=2950539 RepID=A0ABU2FLP3_9EURY|nr:hypothetical protein [Halomicroarcula sp. S3CR25-11]MDS0281207.1 hypothetical protein [Halomicroarcula sp. S3CR25-11]
MSKFTLYRADVDSPRLARVLGKVPGVAVGGEQAASEREAHRASERSRGDGEEPRDAPDEPAAPGASDESEDDGLRETVPVPETDADAKSAVKTYGLLGLGVSMVALGIATVGIWVYRRRTGDGESETPPPSTGLDADATVSPAPSTATDETESDTVLSRPGEQSDEEAEPERGRIEGDRTDVEWTTRDTTPDEEPEATPSELEPSAPGPAEPSADEDRARPTESVDAAPLLGAAFLALSGAVVKWLQSGGEASDEPS